jgi:K+-transporting ATPase ATPase B chain
MLRIEIGAQGSTPLVLAVNTVVIGVIELADKIKPGIAPRIHRLKQMGAAVVLLTGDNYFTTKAIAETVGITDFICEADPERKLAYVRSLQESGKIVAFIGDGANDAPSISNADIGFVMANAPKVAIEAANIVDLDNDPCDRNWQRNSDDQRLHHYLFLCERFFKILCRGADGVYFIE